MMQSRTHNCGELRLADAGKAVTIVGWMENVRDWNISRQLWWGHQIPAYFYGDGKEDFVVAQTFEEAIKLAQQKTEIQV